MWVLVCDHWSVPTGLCRGLMGLHACVCSMVAVGMRSHHRRLEGPPEPAAGANCLIRHEAVYLDA